MTIDPQMLVMFQTMVLPSLKQMPTEALIEVKVFIDDQLGLELSRRQAEGDAIMAELTRRANE